MPDNPNTQHSTPNTQYQLNLSLVCVLWLGVVMGLQLLYASFLLFGPKPVTPAQLETFTRWGRELYRPERDIPLYVMGCAFTIVLCFALRALNWRRLPDSVPPEDSGLPVYAPSPLLSRCSAHLCLGVVGMTLYLPAFFAARGLILTTYPSPHRAVALLLFPIALEAIGFTFSLRSARPLRWPLLARLLRSALSRYARLKAMQTLKAAPARKWQIADIVAPLLICALIYIPHPERLAGDIFHNEHFHHWDYFVMGPAVGYLHGGALCTDIYAQYGIGLPLLFARLNPYYSLGYGHLVQAGMLTSCLYFCGVYLLLRRLRLNPAWSILGVLYLIWMKMFAWSGEWLVVWELPSNTILRAPFDIWFLLALLLHQQSRRSGWLLLAGALTGLSLLFETDTGAYVAFTFGTYCLLWKPEPTTSDTLLFGRHKWSLVAAGWLLAIGILLSGMAIGSRGTMGQAAFWRGWMECFTAYPNGISMMPVVEHPAGILYSMGMCGMCLMTLAYHLLRITRAKFAVLPDIERLAAREDLPLACVALYGTLALLHFIGRSHPANLYVAAMGFTVALVVSLHRLAEVARQVLPAQVTLQRAGKLAFSTLAAAFVALYATSPCARNYPNVFRRWLSPYPPHKLALYANMRDIRLTAVDAPTVRQYNAVVKEARALRAQGRTIAIISNDDTSLYLAAESPLWYRYSPLLPSLISRKQLEGATAKLASKPVDYVFLPSDEPWKSFETWYPLKTTDVYFAIRSTVQAHYTFDHTCGAFDVWRR